MENNDWLEFALENKDFHFNKKRVYVVYMGCVDSIPASEYLYYLWHNITNYGEGLSQIGSVKKLRTIPKALKKVDWRIGNEMILVDNDFHKIEPLDWELEDWKAELDYWTIKRYRRDG